MTEEAPKPTGKPIQEVSLTNKLFPWEGDQPVFLSMPGSEYLYLPCFSSEHDLRAVMTRAGVPFLSIKKIDDGAEFLTSVYENPGALASVKVILDPHFMPNGRVRFVEIKMGLTAAQGFC